MSLAKVVKRKANKDYPEQGIKKGEKYFTWKIRIGRFGGRVCRSKDYPLNSQREGNDYMQWLYNLKESFTFLAPETIEDVIQGMILEIDDQTSELQERIDNLPEQFQQAGPAYEILQERIDTLEKWSSDLQNLDLSDLEEALEKGDKDKIKSAVENLRSEIGAHN